MRKRILWYRRKIDALLKECPSDTDWNAVLREHLQQISFFQHERLIHLIVTMTFAVLTLLSFGIVLMTQLFPLLLLTGALLVLLIPYIFHYYLLENETQKMYAQYDRILLHCHTFSSSAQILESCTSKKANSTK